MSTRSKDQTQKIASNASTQKKERKKRFYTFLFTVGLFEAL